MAATSRSIGDDSSASPSPAEAAAAPPDVSPSASELRRHLAALLDRWPAGPPLPSLVAEARPVVAALLAALERGEIRAAEPDSDAPGGWRVNAWIKQGILLGFRLPGLREWRAASSGPDATQGGSILVARDRAAFGLLDLLDGAGAQAAQAAGAPWRVVPGGTTVRAGTHLQPGVTLMPPSYVNVGAWIGQGTMVDSHVLVGSCAQIGRDVHLSAAVQIGGVLEPAGARPVVVEEGAFVGGGSGLYDGVVVGAGAVIGAGVVLTGQGRLVDLVRERELLGTPDEPLVVPPGSVVVPGTRPAASPWARERGISLVTAVIVKQRDAGTAARVALEAALR
ncbi:MAG: 2,3,4,5-tetrahydropyridine-2,6-dicarboxylate N-succinyltransferase [Chloroflexi bacterium]|nr:2,3,4,5-tetrahydropyridine-2,6-dicarboxylate N-succinyltransferase [Chloroflexota bacterium]